MSSIYEWYGVAGSTAAYGGSAYVDTDNAALNNTIISYGSVSASGGYYGNTAAGAGICIGSGGVQITNSTLAYNYSTAVAILSGPVSIINSIVYFNNGGGSQFSGSPTVNYCDVQNGFTGQSNIDVNPIFLDTVAFHLVALSKCVDAGNPDPAYNDTCFPPSLGGPRNDMGAYGGPLGCQWLSGEAPAIVTQPKSQSSCLDGTVTLSVGASGSTPLAYQWFFMSAAMPGQTNVNLTLTGLQSTNTGPYQVVVSNMFGSITSAVAQLTVYDACIDIHMYAGLNISGQVGSSYVLSYNTDLGCTNCWIPLATNTMSVSGWFYLDMDSPFSPYRFYKAMLQP